MHLMPEETFQRLKARWEKAFKHLGDPDVFDPKIVKAVVCMNTIDELVSIFSCQGHPTEKDRLDLGYIMFGVRDPSWLYRFYEKLGVKAGREKHLIRLTMTHRIDVTLPKEEEAWYPVWNLNWPVRLSKAEKYWDWVNEAAEETLAEYRDEQKKVKETLLQNAQTQVHAG